MPRTAGVFALLAGTKGVTLQTIQSGKYNAFLDDLVNDLNAPRPILAGGTGASTADGAAKELGLVSAKDMAGVNTVGGTANAVTIATDRVYTSLTSTLFLRFIAKADIAAGGMTINLDGIGAKPVKKVVAAGQVSVNAGDIIEGGYYELGYDPTSDNGTDPDGAFILLNPSSTANSIPVGRFVDTAETLNSDFLRRNGALYLRADYPELAAILPALPDGLSWSNVSHSVPASIVFMLQIPTGYMIGVDDGTDTRIFTSTNGTSWSQIATIAGFRVWQMVWTGTFYAATDGNGFTAVSNDGITWAKSATTNNVYGLAWGAGVLVACGPSGSIKTSPDGVTWTTRTSGTTNNLSYARRVGAVFLVVGASGTILSSSDGITWTVRTSGTTAVLYDAAYDGTTYVVVGASGVIRSSTDLVSWTARTSGLSGQINAITRSTSGFVAVGEGGICTISGNGTTWTPTATGVGATLRTITFDPANQNIYFTAGGATIIRGTRTLPTQFATPNDNPTYGWIKAVS